MRVLELLILIRLPLLKQGRRRVLVEKVGGQCAFKGAAEEHGCPRVFLLPAIQIAMTVAARTGQVLADLGIAVDHQATSDPRESSAAVGGKFLPAAKGAKTLGVRAAKAWTNGVRTLTTPPKPTR